MSNDTENGVRTQVIPSRNGFILQFSNDFQTLLTFAEAYFYLGYSVIPLLGDRAPDRSKTPAIGWSDFQKRRASLREHQVWFNSQGYAGLGIVTGSISGLVVLDFDSETVYRLFKAQHPDLLETHTVRSAGRQLSHLYFKLPSHLSFPSQKGQGIDLLSDGRYVVAPPTTINGQAYKVSYGALPKTLTERDIRRIQTFINQFKDAPQPTLSTPPSVLPVPSNTPQPSHPITEADLHALYRHLVTTRGRNEALFHTSLFARDARLTLQQTQNSLVALHSQQKTSTPIRENARHREQEALKTIQSAFSRPPRSLHPSPARQRVQVSNSVREALMSRKMTYVLRTYEGLLQSGMHAGQRFSAAEALKHLSGLVGRDSVLKALKSEHEGVLFFAPPVSPQNTANAFAYSHDEKKSKKCFLIESKNKKKPQGGRPHRLYQLPSNKQLCRIFGVKMTASDALPREELHTARQTRLALHTEFIKRRPGSYTKHWLAARLGVSRRTIFSYNHLVPIRSRATYLETDIGWKTVERLPLDEPLQGAYLQTLRGRKFPALRQIASRLLANGEQVCLKEQAANYYWYGDAEPSPLEWTKRATEQAERQELVAAYVERHIITIAPLPQPAPKPQKSKPVLSRTAYKQPLQNVALETLANHLYDALNQMREGSIDFKKISKVTARRLVATEDKTRIEKALVRLKEKSLHGNLRNPVGFFITLMRGEKL